jgi:hypothetical protein
MGAPVVLTLNVNMTTIEHFATNFGTDASHLTLELAFHYS